MVVQSIICLGNAQTIEKGVEAWKVEAASADAVRDLEDLLVAALALERLIDQIQARAWKALLAGEIANPQEAGEKLKDMYDAAAKAFAPLETGLVRVEADNWEVDHASEFCAAYSRFKALLDRFNEQWPVYDCAELEEARARMDRGEFVTMEELLREVDDPD